MNILVTSLLAITVLTVSAREIGKDEKCDPCDESKCKTPGDCLAGTVKDSCGCCFVCGLKEGERCQEGVCGENMECRMRMDLPQDDPPEALCFCTQKEPICGSDGQTYENVCQLTEARYKRRDGLVALSRGPCKSAPTIVLLPENVDVITGQSEGLSCEVKGFPVPTVNWKVDRGDGQLQPLPSDDSHLSVQSRGGPNPHEVTSWVQIQHADINDKGTYWCVATNEMGEDMASASLKVTDPSHKGLPKDGWKGPNSL